MVTFISLETAKAANKVLAKQLTKVQRPVSFDEIHASCLDTDFAVYDTGYFYPICVVCDTIDVQQPSKG
jgi:hypothetical protein